MSNRDVKLLRERVLSRQSDVDRKVARLRRNNGVEITGTNFDPRVDRSKISRMNSSQLRSLEKSLNGFMARDNQFVGDANSKPIHISVWREFKKSEAKYNKALTENYNRFKDIHITPLKKTVEERRQHVRPLFPHMVNSSVSAMYEPSDLSPEQIGKASSLGKLISRFAKKADKKNIKNELREARNQFKALMDVYDDPEISSLFNSLSDDQTHLLWNYTNFVDRLSTRYEVKMGLKKGKRNKLASDDESLTQANRGALDLLNWAKKVEIKS